LIRLPKADTIYEYYDWTDTNSTPAAGNGVKAVSKPNFAFQQDDGTNTNHLVTLFTVPYSYRLVTDEHQHDGDLEYSIDAMQQNGDYVLVGNPYMVSIDMKKFFANNTTLSTDGYWTYEGSTATAYTVPSQTNTNLIKPMQAFFVKKGTAESIIFNKDMQVDGNFPPIVSAGGNARKMTMTLSAANSQGSSSACVELSKKASVGYVGDEDVETLFDSNLADVPMVYTVTADGQAVSINQLPELHIVPFGVTCSSDDVVEVAIGGTEVVDGRLYVFDALTDQFTEVGEGSIINVTPNEYGRYYLTRSSSLLEIAESSAATDITVIARGGKIIVRSKELLGSVRVVTAGGSVVYSYDGGSNETSCRVADGIYIVEAETQNTKKTLKVIVR
jgi:hypothetical protein